MLAIGRIELTKEPFTLESYRRDMILEIDEINILRYEVLVLWLFRSEKSLGDDELWNFRLSFDACSEAKTEPSVYSHLNSTSTSNLDAVRKLTRCLNQHIKRLGSKQAFLQGGRHIRHQLV